MSRATDDPAAVLGHSSASVGRQRESRADAEQQFPLHRSPSQPAAFAINRSSTVEANMRLDEIDGSSAAERRVDRLKANAKTMKDRAKQLKSQADASAAQLKMRQSRTQKSLVSKAAQTSMIRPHT